MDSNGFLIRFRVQFFTQSGDLKNKCFDSFPECLFSLPTAVCLSIVMYCWMSNGKRDYMRNNTEYFLMLIVNIHVCT